MMDNNPISVVDSGIVSAVLVRRAGAELRAMVGGSAARPAGAYDSRQLVCERRGWRASGWIGRLRPDHVVRWSMS